MRSNILTYSASFSSDEPDRCSPETYLPTEKSDQISTLSVSKVCLWILNHSVIMCSIWEGNSTLSLHLYKDIFMFTGARYLFFCSCLVTNTHGSPHMNEGTTQLTIIECCNHKVTTSTKLTQSSVKSETSRETAVCVFSYNFTPYKDVWHIRAVLMFYLRVRFVTTLSNTITNLDINTTCPF